MSLVNWTPEQVRFEREFKPRLARLIKETMPELRFEGATQERFVDKFGEHRIALRITMSDSLAGMALEAMSSP